ncbi:MAG: leucine-rich repeat protein [Clostridia bacterium]|nr:leucine-rich repeat protein [Clostridia bacterium]
MKRVLSLVLVVCIIFAVAPVGVLAGEVWNDDEISFAFSETNEKTIFNYCINDMDLNIAATCAVLANVFCESSFNPNKLGDYIDGTYTSYGICQWHAGRYNNLKNWCNQNGYDYTTLNGQLHFLKYELKNSYSSVWSKLQSVKNNEDGCREAAMYWCAVYEVPEGFGYWENGVLNYGTTSIYRGNLAIETYWDKYANNSETGAYMATADAYKLVDYLNGLVGNYFESGKCQAFVYQSLNKCLGVENTVVSCCATKAWQNYGVAYSRDDIPLGAAVYFGGSNTVDSYCGQKAGHVGLYIGDDYIVHVWGAKVVKTTIDYVINRGYTYRGWGWQGEYELIDYIVSTEVNIAFPENDSWQDPRKDIVIKWNAMEGAAGYRVAVKCDSGIHEGEKPYDNVWTTGTSFTIPYGTLYHNESYKIWVGGYESKSASEAITAGNSISINIMSGPQIDSPSNGYEYAHPANTTVTWTAVESASSYIIKLVNTETGEVIYNNEDIGDTLSYTFTDLEEDTEYKFAVGTDDGWWNQGDFYFSTSEFPVISYPGNNDVCDSKSVTVKWSSVPGAEDYRLILKDASGNIISGYNEVSTNGKTSYTVTGLEKGETYKVNVYGVIDDGNTVQKFWGKKTVVFTIADDKVEETVTLNWRDYEDGEIKEYTIDSSSAKPKRPYSFFFETNSAEAPVIKISDNTVIKAVLGDNVVTVTCIGEGNASLTLSVEGKSIKLNFIVTDTAEETKTTLSWSNYEDGYIHECLIDVENAIFERPFVLYYETNSSKAPVLTISNEYVINAEIAENCVNVNYIGAGESILTLSVDGVSISFTFIVSDIGGEEAEIVDSGTDTNGIAWTIDVNGVLTFSGTGAMQDYADMTESPFYNNTDIKKVVIEEGVTSMGDYVLYGCESIAEIALSDSIEIVGFAAMHSCSSLENIILPERLCEIRNNAFYGCSGLKEVIIPESVKVIPKRCFMKCESLANAVLHDGITEIGEDAFRECASLKQIELPEKLTTVGKNCFRDCTALENIVIPVAVQTVNKGAFRGCTALESAEFKNTLAEAEQDLFYECSNLTTVVLPVGIEIIGDAVFCGCEQLSYVYFSGEESEWLSVEVGDDNEVLASATIYYTESEKEPFEIEITEDDFEVRFDISIKEKCVVYVAEYEGETMINASIMPVNANEAISVTAVKDEEERLMKIFVWSEDMKPYTEVVERIVK